MYDDYIIYYGTPPPMGAPLRDPPYGTPLPNTAGFRRELGFIRTKQLTPPPPPLWGPRPPYRTRTELNWTAV